MNTLLSKTTGHDALTDSYVRLRHGNAKSTRPCRGVDRHEPAGRRIGLAAGEHEDASLSVNDGRNRRGVARPPRLPALQTSRPVILSKPSDRRAAGRADVHDQQAAFDERRRSGAEEVLTRRGSRRRGRASRPPFPFPGPGRTAGPARRPCTPRGVDDGARSRAVVVSVPVLEVSGIPELPVRRARLGVKALDDFFVAQSMHEHEALARNRGRRVTGALVELPEERRG